MTWAHGVGSRPRHRKFIVLPQFRTSDQHEVMKRLPVQLKNLHFTTVFMDVRRARSDERVARGPKEFAFHHSFGRPTSTKWREGCLPPRPTKPTLRKRKEEILKRSSIFEEQRSQQLFSADFLSSSSQQLFPAAFLSSSFLNSFSQQPFSAAFLSSSSQQLFSAAFLSSSSQQLFSAAFLSSSSQQLFSAALLSYHLAVVRGWWSASNIIFSSSSQLSSCCGQGLVVS